MQSLVAISPMSSSPADPLAVAKGDPEEGGLPSFGESFAASGKRAEAVAASGDACGVAVPEAVWFGAGMPATRIPLLRADGTALAQADGTSAEAGLGLAIGSGRNDAASRAAPSARGMPDCVAPVAPCGVSWEDGASEPIRRLLDGENVRTGPEIGMEAGPDAGHGPVIAVLAWGEASGSVKSDRVDLGAGHIAGAIPVNKVPSPDPAMGARPLAGPQAVIAPLPETGAPVTVLPTRTYADSLASPFVSQDSANDDGTEVGFQARRTSIDAGQQTEPIAVRREIAVRDSQPNPALASPPGYRTAPSPTGPQTDTAVALPDAASFDPAAVGRSVLSAVSGGGGPAPDKPPGFWERFFTDLQNPMAADAGKPTVPATGSAPPHAERLADAGRAAILGVEVGPVKESSGAAGTADPPLHRREQLVADEAGLLQGKARLPTDVVSIEVRALPLAGGAGGLEPALAVVDQGEPADPLSLLSGIALPGPVPTNPILIGPAQIAVDLPVPQLAQQIRGALALVSDGATELALSPDELGHVRLRLEPDSANPDRMVVMITFERPETLDLFRRHASELAEGLRAAGYAGADIGFGQEGGGSFGSDQSDGLAASRYDTTTGPTPSDPVGPAPRLMAGTSLDLRL